MRQVARLDRHGNTVGLEDRPRFGVFADRRNARREPVVIGLVGNRDARVVARIRRMGGRSCEPRHCRGSENQARMKLLRQ